MPIPFHQRLAILIASATLLVACGAPVTTTLPTQSVRQATPVPVAIAVPVATVAVAPATDMSVISAGNRVTMIDTVLLPATK